jgi:hypothetical protein
VLTNQYTNIKLEAMKISEMPLASSITGSEVFEIVQDGQSRQCSITEILSAAPDANGVYPDVPLNRICVKRYAMQASTIPAIEGNLGMIALITATAYPCLVDSNSIEVARLNGSDVTKTADGRPAVLDDPTLQVMTKMGGVWTKYEYNAATNEKTFKYSIYKVRGYRYIRRRYVGCYGGTVQDGKLLSIAGQWTTQSKNIQQYHEHAKALGDNFREYACQDHEVFRMYFWLIHQTFNSQSIYAGIPNANWTWWYTNLGNVDAGGIQCAPFHKTGITNSIKGHEGETSVTCTNKEDVSCTVKPNKFLWCENRLSGPYFIWATGYLKKDQIWYRCNDLSKIAFTVTDDYEAFCEDVTKDTTTNEGWALELFEDTLIPNALGASDSTGFCDWCWSTSTPSEGGVYVPALVGSALYGSRCGLSVSNSSHVASYAHPYFGAALASDDPTDTTPERTIAV